LAHLAPLVSRPLFEDPSAQYRALKLLGGRFEAPGEGRGSAAVAGAEALRGSLRFGDGQRSATLMLLLTALPQGQPQAQPQLLSEISPAARSRDRESGSLEPDQLQLTSSQPSWLEIKTKTGTTLFRGTFTGERSFPLGPGLEVLAGRPDLVRTQIGGGAAQPMGAIDQVRWRSFRAPAP
jgi:hypothetical protein